MLLLGEVFEEVVVEVVEGLGGSTVHIVPPVTDEILLMKHCSIGTEETVADQTIVC